jgi:flagellar biosynthesis protein
MLAPSANGKTPLPSTRDKLLDITSSGAEREPVAVAIKYERGKDPAPRVVAKGTGHIAETILALAREHGIAVRNDAALAEVLAQIELDRQIPVEAYVAVAEVLSYIFGARAKAAGHASAGAGARS